MKKYNIIIFILLSVILSGCSIVKLNVQTALNYMKDKYDENFIVEDHNLYDYLSANDEIFCYSESMDPSSNERVHIFVVNDNNKIYFIDDYFGYLIRPQCEDYIKNTIQTEFSDVKVLQNLETRGIDRFLNKDSTLDDFFTTDQKYRIRANLYIKYEPYMTRTDYINKLENIMSIFAQKHDTWFFKCYVVPDNIFNTIDRSTQDDFLHQCIKLWDPDGETFYTDDSITIEKGELKVDWTQAKHCLN